MSGHTKGPWRIDRRDENWEIVGKLERATRFGKKGEWTVCSIDAEDLPKPVVRANARLISAAPDLYEALFLARDWVKYVESSDECDDATLQAMDIIDAALKKARGG